MITKINFNKKKNVRVICLINNYDYNKSNYNTVNANCYNMCYFRLTSNIIAIK